MSDGMPKNADELAIWLGNAYNAGYRQAVSNGAQSAEGAELNWVSERLGGLRYGLAVIKSNMLDPSRAIDVLSRQIDYETTIYKHAHRRDS